jgi:hypothetical protein
LQLHHEIATGQAKCLRRAGHGCRRSANCLFARVPTAFPRGAAAIREERQANYANLGRPPTLPRHWPPARGPVQNSRNDVLTPRNSRWQAEAGRQAELVLTLAEVAVRPASRAAW